MLRRGAIRERPLQDDPDEPLGSVLLLSGECSTTRGDADRVSGDLEVLRLSLLGTESFGRAAYQVLFERLAGDEYTPEERPIYCAWYSFEDQPRLDDTGERKPCDFTSLGCSAELRVSATAE